MSPNTWELFLLTSLPGFGPRSIRLLLRQAAALGLSVDEVLQLSEAAFGESFPELGKGRFSQAKHSSLAALDRPALQAEFQLLQDRGIHLLTEADEHYPARLSQRLGDDAPLLLYAKGNPARLADPALAVVGSRSITDEVARKARILSARLARSGFVIVSGNAKGVDQAAHLGALDANGATLLVLPDGILRFSPTPEQRDFPNFSEAVVLSQFRPQERFSGTNAMRRNLLICALSDAVVVVAASAHAEEGTKKSGSLDAGEQALKLGLPLYVVSPTLLRPEPAGNHLLIEAGGREISHASDVLDRLDLHLLEGRWPAAYAAEVDARRKDHLRQRKPKSAPASDQMSLF